MQPTPLLPIADVTALDSTALTAAPASPVTRNLAAAFAELLGENIDTGDALSGVGGGGLPEFGNILPVAPESATDDPTDPEAIVASLQRELENLGGEDVTLTDRPQELPFPEIDVEVDVATAAPKPTPTLAPPTSVAIPPQTIATLDVISETVGKSSAAPVLPPAAPLPVELSKASTPPAPPVVVLPQTQAEIRQALPREPVPVRPRSVPVTPGVTANDSGSVEVIRAQTVSDEIAVQRKDSPTPGGSLPVSPANASAAASVSPTAADAPPAAALASVPAAARNLAATPLAAAEVASAVASRIDLPVQESGWDKAISERVLMMANNKLQNVEIRLTPAALGPLRVQLEIQDGAANVSFAVQHALTREAIEQALPRLREMLAETGLTLGEASVGEEGLDHSATSEGESRAPTVIHAPEDGAPGSDIPVDAPQPMRVTDGLVDTFV